MKDETFILLAGFNLIDIARKYLPCKLIDEQIQRNPNWQEKFKRVLQYWRFDDAIPCDFYSTLRQFYPDPIPFSLFFSFSELKDIENIRWIGDLANKWLMDIFSGESFAKRNKEYFTKPEVKQFLVCNWVQLNKNQQRMCNYTDLAYHFFDAKIKANNLTFSPNILVEAFKNFFSQKMMLKDFLFFICNNIKRIRDEEIYSISYYINREYLSKGEDFDFNKQIYKDLKQLIDVWYVSNYLEERNGRFAMYKDHKTMMDYIQFICNKLIRENIKKFSHCKITDFGYYFRLFEKSKAEIGISASSDYWYHDYDYQDYYWYDYWYGYGYWDGYDYEFADDVGFLPIFLGNDMKKINDIFDFLRVEYIETGIDFNFNNRAWRSLKRLSDEWHIPILAEQERVRNELEQSRFDELLNTNWEKSQIKDFTYKKDGKIWTITEITSGKLLHEEGEIMHHCCFSYVKDCVNKFCMIFSVKCGEKRIATVEISKRMKITQVRGEYNSSISKETEDIIKHWAKENQIRGVQLEYER